MKGAEFLRIRKFFGLSRVEWMYQLGYIGTDNTMEQVCRRYEKDKKGIPLYLAQYVWLIEQWGRAQPPIAPAEAALPKWPKWPAYYPEEEEMPAKPLPKITLQDALKRSLSGGN